jgi:hypothetical protein
MSERYHRNRRTGNREFFPPLKKGGEGGFSEERREQVRERESF